MLVPSLWLIMPIKSSICSYSVIMRRIRWNWIWRTTKLSLRLLSCQTSYSAHLSNTSSLLRRPCHVNAFCSSDALRLWWYAVKSALAMSCFTGSFFSSSPAGDVWSYAREKSLLGIGIVHIDSAWPGVPWICYQSYKHECGICPAIKWLDAIWCIHVHSRPGRNLEKIWISEIY